MAFVLFRPSFGREPKDNRLLGSGGCENFEEVGWLEKCLFVSGREDYFNSIKSVSHPKLLPLSFQNPNINSLKNREAAKGFPLV